MPRAVNIAGAFPREREPLVTPGDIPVPKVLKAAKDVCTQVLLLGEDAEGEPYMAASIGDKAVLLYWIEAFKFRLLAGDFD